MTDGLQPFQTIINPDTLYRTYADLSHNLTRNQEWEIQLQPSIENYGEAADVYQSQILPATAPTGMPVTFSALEGVAQVDCIPNYLYVEAGESPPTAIVLTGIMAFALYQMTASIYSLTSVAAPLTGAATNAMTAGVYSVTYVAAPLTSP